MRHIGIRLTAVLAAVALALTPVTAAEGAQVEGTIVEDADTEVTAELNDDTYQGDTDVEAEITDEDDDHVVIANSDKPYLALGADLKEDQKKTVLSLMGISPDSLEQYQVTTVTNAEEHEYLDAYLPSSTIGTRALSSVVIVKRDKGNGIHISTKNISYCTVGMYKNALATAGLEDADVIVAGPFPLSGTAALIGAMKAYADMEGTSVDEDSLDAAMNEIVVTGDLNEAMGDEEQTEEFMAYVKEQVVKKGLSDPKEIEKELTEAAEKFDLQLTDEQLEQINSLMQKIGSLDLDVDSLLQQASSVYDNIAGLTKNPGVRSFFQRLLDAIAAFFGKLFG